MKRLGLLVLGLLLGWSSRAQSGYEVKVSIEEYASPNIQLANFLMDKQYLVDTAYLEEGRYVFKGEEKLPGGVYLVILPPDNQYFQVLIPPGDQQFSIQTSLEGLTDKLVFEGSPENQRFYEYLAFLAEQGEKAQPLRAELKQAREEGKKTKKLEKELSTIDEAVKARQKALIENQPESVGAQLIKATLEPAIPEFEGDQKTVDLKRYQYFRQHYFDNIDLGNPVMLRTPILFQKVDDYINKYTIQHPDSIKHSLDLVLGHMEAAPETFKYYLVHFLNFYAKSKYIGQDAVYVHLVENYYAKGKADWTDEEQLNKIIENAKTLKPLLIGKVAPDLALNTLDIEGTIALKEHEKELLRVKTAAPVALHEVEADYTVLVFWEPTCGHCKKSMPKLGEFYEKWKDKGVEVYAVCGKTVKENGMVQCAEFIKDKKLTGWINVVDPYYRTKFKTTYDIKSTPQIYLLDSNKEILSKRLGVEQIEEVLTQIIDQRSQEGGVGSR